MSGAVLPMLLLALVFAVLLLGFPVALTLSGVSLGFALVAGAAGAFDVTLLMALGPRIWGVLTNELLLAIPLFILMGTVLDRSQIAADLLRTMGDLLRHVPGGLGLSLCMVGALLAASTGIVGATVVAMGLISLPALLARGYPKPLATGLICASGSLGQVIPPSIVLVLLADQLGATYGEAQRAVGNWTAQPVSVGDMFAGAFVPGFLLVGVYAVYVFVVCRIRRIDVDSTEMAPAEPVAITTLVRTLMAPLLLLVAVLGSILGGVATPTEAAGLGAMGAVLLAGIREDPGREALVWTGIAALLAALLIRALADTRLQQFFAASVTGAATIIALTALVVAGALLHAVMTIARSGVLGEALRQTLQISAMVYGILIGATCFALVFRGVEGDVMVGDFLRTLPGGDTGALVFVMAAVFLLGFFLDVIEIITLAVPILALTLLQTIDPLWFGVLIAVNLQTSYLTPPFGFALFYLRGVAPDSVRTVEMYRGVVPFVVLQLAVLAILIAFPGLVTGLPNLLWN